MTDRFPERTRAIARRVRLARLHAGMSQSALATALGLTFQQVQKYEKGTNRVSAASLAEIAEILGQPIGFFYEAEDTPPASGRAGGRTVRDLLAAGQALEALDPPVRSAAVKLLKAIGATRAPAAEPPAEAA